MGESSGYGSATGVPFFLGGENLVPFFNLHCGFFILHRPRNPLLWFRSLAALQLKEKALVRCTVSVIFECVCLRYRPISMTIRIKTRAGGGRERE